MTEPRTWILDAGWARPPITMNDERHWRYRWRAAQAIHARIRAAVTHLKIPPLTGIHVAMHYYPPDRRRRDEDNLTRTQKHVIDALAAAGLVPDDTPESVDWVKPQIHPPDRDHPRIEFVLTEIPAKKDAACPGYSSTTATTKTNASRH